MCMSENISLFIWELVFFLWKWQITNVHLGKHSFIVPFSVLSMVHIPASIPLKYMALIYIKRPSKNSTQQIKQNIFWSCYNLRVASPMWLSQTFISCGAPPSFFWVMLLLRLRVSNINYYSNRVLSPCVLSPPECLLQRRRKIAFVYLQM